MPAPLLQCARAGPGAALLGGPCGPGPGASRSSPRAGGSRRSGRGAGTARAGARALRLPRPASGALWPGPPPHGAPLGSRPERRGTRKLRARPGLRSGAPGAGRAEPGGKPLLRGRWAGDSRVSPSRSRSPGRLPGRVWPRDSAGPSLPFLCLRYLPGSLPFSLSPLHLCFRRLFLPLSILLSLLYICLLFLLRNFYLPFSLCLYLLPLYFPISSLSPFFLSIFSFSFPSLSRLAPPVPVLGREESHLEPGLCSRVWGGSVGQ